MDATARKPRGVQPASSRLQHPTRGRGQPDQRRGGQQRQRFKNSRRPRSQLGCHGSGTRGLPSASAPSSGPAFPPHIKTQPPPALPPSSSEAASSRAAHERTPIPRGSTESTSHEAQDAFYHEVRAVAAGVRGHGRREEEDGPRGPAPGRRRQGAAHLGARQGRRRRRPRRRAPRIHGRRRRCAHL